MPASLGVVPSAVSAGLERFHFHVCCAGGAVSGNLARSHYVFINVGGNLWPQVSKTETLGDYAAQGPKLKRGE